MITYTPTAADQLIEEAVTLADFYAVARRLMHPRSVEEWMNTSHPELNDRRPCDLIQNGDLQGLKTLLHGVHSDEPG